MEENDAEFATEQAEIAERKMLEKYDCDDDV